jgi:hypothetical protein
MNREGKLPERQKIPQAVFPVSISPLISIYPPAFGSSTLFGAACSYAACSPAPILVFAMASLLAFGLRHTRQPCLQTRRHQQNSRKKTARASRAVFYSGKFLFRRDEKPR